MQNLIHLFNLIKSKRAFLPEEATLIKHAYELAQKAHAGQKRKSGDPYFTHSFEAALKLAEWGLDTPTIAAGLLHDVAEDTPITLEQIEKEFGKEIAFLISGVTKLGKLKYRGAKNGNDRAEYLTENLRKMILAISEDLRVVFIKLADRLHNMKTLSALPHTKQRRVALESLDIYAPLAYRLGMQNLAGELEDLAFPYLHPQEYKWLTEKIKEHYDERLKYLERVKPLILIALKKNNIFPEKVDCRAKRISSLYRKLLRFDMNLEQIYDLVAFRIIVNSVENCYGALGIIHQLWPPLPGRIKDYIALPKPNGYRSLHTTVFCLDKKPVEFQIRTNLMHEEAENGIAAHWAYNQIKSAKGKTSFADTKELRWVQQLKVWQNEFTDSKEFIRSLKIDFFKDRVFAITPTGEVVDLPMGATPVDFAYHIHTEIGNQCTGAKINGRIMPLDYQIQSGDVIEILTQKSKRPSESWLNFAKTANARRRIKSSVKTKSGILNIPRQTEFRIVVKDRIGILKDISAIISRSRINIVAANVPKGTNYPAIKILCDTNNKESAERLILKIKNLDGVKEISYKII